MYAARIGNESVGISLDQTKNQKAKAYASLLRMPNVQFITADLRNLDKLGNGLGRFDQIICFETIEHIRNDKKLMTDLSLLLKPGGRLLLTTPFRNYKRLLGDKLSEHEDGGHVRWGYTHAEMRELFEKCALNVAAEEYISGFVSQQLTNFIRLLSAANPRIAWIVTLPLRILQILDSPLTRLIRYPYLSIGIVGVKRACASISSDSEANPCGSFQGPRRCGRTEQNG